MVSWLKISKKSCWTYSRSMKRSSKLQSKVRRYGSRQIEKKYEINGRFSKLVQKTLLCIGEDNVERARTVLEWLVHQLGEHQEHLLIADALLHGWLAVAKIRSTKELPNTLRKHMACGG